MGAQPAGYARPSFFTPACGLTSAAGRILSNPVRVSRLLDPHGPNTFLVPNNAGSMPAWRSPKRSVPRHPQQEVKRWQNR